MTVLVVVVQQILSCHIISLNVCQSCNVCSNVGEHHSIRINWFPCTLGHYDVVSQRERDGGLYKNIRVLENFFFCGASIYLCQAKKVMGFSFS